MRRRRQIIARDIYTHPEKMANRRPSRLAKQRSIDVETYTYELTRQVSKSEQPKSDRSTWTNLVQKHVVFTMIRSSRHQIRRCAERQRLDTHAVTPDLITIDLEGRLGLCVQARSQSSRSAGQERQNTTSVKPLPRAVTKLATQLVMRSRKLKYHGL